MEYRVVLAKDLETGNEVAEVPALGIAALANIKAMATFHLECLRDEAKPIPAGEGRGRN